MNCKHCERAAYCRTLCKRHYTKFLRYGNPLHGYSHNRARGSGTVQADGYIEMRTNGVARLEHLLVAEKALGKRLPRKARVHHVDENRTNNVPGNLVICPNDAYHQLLHMRMRALKECGNADWLKCQYCKRWDSPQNVLLGKRVKFHRECKNGYENRRNHEHRRHSV